MSHEEPPPNRFLNWLGVLALCMCIPWLVMQKHHSNFHQAATLVGMTGTSAFLILFASLIIAEHRGKRAGIGALAALFACLACMVVPLLFAAPSASWSDETKHLAITTLACAFIPLLFLASVWTGTELAGLPARRVLAASAANAGLFIWAGLSPHLFPRILYGALLFLVVAAWLRADRSKLFPPS